MAVATEVDIIVEEALLDTRMNYGREVVNLECDND